MSDHFWEDEDGATRDDRGVSHDPDTGLPIDITSPGGPPPGGYDDRDPNAGHVNPDTGQFDPDNYWPREQPVQAPPETPTTNAPPTAPGAPKPPTPPGPPAPKPKAPSNPGAVNPPPPATSTYRPPAFAPSPFITADGRVPPGLPYSPDPHAVALQNAALEKAINTPAVEKFVNPYQGAQDQLVNQFLTTPVVKPFVNPFQGAQDTLMHKFLNEPQYDQTYINGLNEQQKEIALAREGQATRGILQRAASRGVQAGGQVQAGMRRASQDTTSNLLQSQRDINLDVAGRNREGYERAVGLSDALNRARSEEQFRVDTTNRAAYERGVGLSDQLASGQADRDFRTDSTNRSALLDALGMSESIYGGREDRGLNASRFMESIRQFDNDMKERQAEFGATNQYGYDSLNTNNRFNYDNMNNTTRFNYDNLNSMNERDWLNYLARLAGR